MNQIQFILEFLSTVTKCDNDVLFRKMDDCDQAPQCAVGGGQGGELFHFPAWRNVAVTGWGQATVVLTIQWSPAEWGRVTQWRYNCYFADSLKNSISAAVTNSPAQHPASSQPSQLIHF